MMGSSRESAQVAAEIEPAFSLILERNIDDGQIRQVIWNACMAVLRLA